MKKIEYFLLIIVVLLILVQSCKTFGKYQYGVSEKLKITSDKFYANGEVLYDKYVLEDNKSVITNVSINNFIDDDQTDLDITFEVSIVSNIFNLLIDDTVFEDGKSTIVVNGKQKNTKNLNIAFALKDGKTLTDSTNILLEIKTISPYTKDVLTKQITIENKENLNEHIILKRDVWSSGLSGDGVRYIGKSPDNYVCFGTTDKDTCLGNKDVYMYRIIGVFKDSSNINHTKLIKYKQLKNKSVWYTSDAKATWGTSVINRNINGSHFLTKTGTYPYLVTTSPWYSSIVKWDYKSFIGHSGTFTDAYLRELKAPTYPGLIGLMYDSDIGLALGNSGLSTTAWRNSSNPLKESWLHQNNNDTSVSTTEWTISIYCYACTHYYANGITRAGTLDAIRFEIDAFSSRPVFYLTESMKYVSGNGEKTNPYIIENS